MLHGLADLADLAAGLVGAGTHAGPGDAVARLEAAAGGFRAAALPLEEARARMALAALLAPTAPAVARSEAKDALVTFERLGAAPGAGPAPRAWVC
jgi:hypothetical protein